MVTGHTLIFRRRTANRKTISPASDTRVRFWPLVALLAVLCVLSHGERAAGQSRISKGDAIEVRFLQEWRPAVAIQVDRAGNVLAEYTFGTNTRQQPFPPGMVRLPCEGGSLGPARRWSDATNKFSIRAALLNIGGKTVKLRKLDMTEIDVPISKLRAVDQSYIKRIEKEAGPSAAGPAGAPPLEEFAISYASSPIGKVGRVALAPDPKPAYLTMKQGGAAFPTEQFGERVTTVLPVGGPDGWVLAGLESFAINDPAPARLLWVSLKRQKVENRLPLSPNETLLDYHPPSHRLLTCGPKQSGMSASKSILTVWEMLPTDKKLTPIVRWDTGVTEHRSEPPWARLIDGNTVIQRWKSPELAAWDISAKKMRYRIKQARAGAPEPVLSGGRKYLFVPEGGQVCVYEASSGRMLSTLPGRSSAVAITEDGRRAAVLNSKGLVVWDLTDADADPQEFQSEAIGTPFATKLSWVGKDRLMASVRAGDLVLFSLEHRIAVWTYTFARTGPNIVGQKNARPYEIVAGHLIYSALIQEGPQRGLAVGAVKLPGPKVEETLAAAAENSLMILKPGSSIRLVIPAGEHNSEVQQALERRIKANGWSVDPDASATLIAEVTREKSQEVTYKSYKNKTSEVITTTPYSSSVRVEHDGEIAWRSPPSPGIPYMVWLQEGETARSKAEQNSRPDITFFSKLPLPQTVLNPKMKKGLGTSKVGTGGLIPVERRKESRAIGNESREPSP